MAPAPLPGGPRYRVSRPVGLHRSGRAASSAATRSRNSARSDRPVARPAVPPRPQLVGGREIGPGIAVLDRPARAGLSLRADGGDSCERPARRRHRSSRHAARPPVPPTAIDHAPLSACRRFPLVHRCAIRRRTCEAGGMDEKSILIRSTACRRGAPAARGRRSAGEITSDEERTRLRTLEESLDQCWDLLRRRRAARSSGSSPTGRAATGPRSRVPAVAPAAPL